MSWRLYRWIWLVESPLAVGAPPAGSLNRCRLYVPAWTLWGALTAERARATAHREEPGYAEIGKTLKDEIRLTYLFPAERPGEDWLAWLPAYEECSGLVWRREDVWHREDGKTADDRTLRERLLTTRASTAIDPRSDAAAEGSLRETECITDRWRSNGSHVGMIGYVLVREEAEFSPTRDFVIHVGGDTRYGLGRLRCVEVAEAAKLFGCAVALDHEDPPISSRIVLAHAQAAHDADRICDNNPRGSLELLSGWDRGQLEPRGAGLPLWAPGSCWQRGLSWTISQQGIWRFGSDRMSERRPRVDPAAPPERPREDNGHHAQPA